MSFTETKSSEDLVAVVPRVRRTGGADARIDIARLLMQRGLVEAAVDLMDGIQGVDEAVFSASVALERGRTAQALSQAEAVLREDDAHCYSRYVESRALNDLGRHRDAVYSAQLATNECPTLLEGWVALAEAYNDLELDTQSDRAFTEGLDANPQEPWLAEQYAAWLAANGRDRKAVAVERKLTRAMPGYTPAWNAYLARCQSLSASCQSVAREGRAASLTIYGVDPPPGERAAGGLFGRFLIR